MTINETSTVQGYTGAGEPAGGPAPFPKREFGKDVAREFLFDPSWHNLNHGSFGSIPRAIQAIQRHYQDQSEARPDQFIRYDWISLLDASREAIAPLLGVPPETVVLVSNATTGVNTVLRSMEWDPDGRDEILYFSTIYGACLTTITYVVELSLGRASSRCVRLDYPCGDDEVVARFRAAVTQSRAEGKRPRIALFDVVSSIPGLRFPFEAVVAACREEGVLSLVDGAQGVGMVDLSHVGKVDPDFFTSNAHKWLFVPRGCAVLSVPLRNQGMIRSTLPTSHGFIARPGTGPQHVSPLPRDSGKSGFLTNFQFVGTIDNAPYMCIKDSIRWRQEVLGGEEKIRGYVTRLAKEGGRKVAEILGTEVLENEEGTLTDCGMVNVALPVGVAASGEEVEALKKELKGVKVVIRGADAARAQDWMQRALMADHQTFMPVFVYKRRFWCRLSAQVYLGMEDFEFAGRALLALSERIGGFEFGRLEDGLAQLELKE